MPPDKITPPLDPAAACPVASLISPDAPLLVVPVLKLM